MDQSWFRKLFSRPPEPPAVSPQGKADAEGAEAQFHLGSSFVEVKGTEPDYTQAAHWYLKAADQDHALAQFSLGMMFADGQGVLQDNDQAEMWIRRAAQQGHAGAQHRLGLKHRRASFESQPDDALESNLEAYKWFGLAAAQGHRGSEAEREGLALMLTREQVKEGNRRVDTFAALKPQSVQV